MSKNPADGIMTLEEAKAWRARLRREGKRLVVTNGCFDLLHRGHAEYLYESRELGDALLILVARVFLGAVFSGQMMTLFYSLGGGLLCWLVLLLLSRLLTWKQIWLCSPISAVFHNLGQLLVAAALLGSWTVLAYLPYLVVAGAASGLFTGLCAQLLAGRLKGLGRR